MQLTLKQWFARFRDPELRAQLLAIEPSMMPSVRATKMSSASRAIIVLNWGLNGPPVIGGSWRNLFLDITKNQDRYVLPPPPSALRLPDQRAMRKLLLLPVCKSAVLGLFEAVSE